MIVHCCSFCCLISRHDDNTPLTAFFQDNPVRRNQNVFILDFIGAKGDGGDGTVRHAKLRSNRHKQNNTQLFTGQIPFLSPNQQCQSTEGKNITLHGFVTPSSPEDLPTWSLSTKGSCLPWGEDCQASCQPSDASTHCLISRAMRISHKTAVWAHDSLQ